MDCGGMTERGGGAPMPWGLRVLEDRRRRPGPWRETDDRDRDWFGDRKDERREGRREAQRGRGGEAWAAAGVVPRGVPRAAALQLPAEAANLLVATFLATLESTRPGTFHAPGFLAECRSGGTHPAVWAASLWYASLFTHHHAVDSHARAALQRYARDQLADLLGAFWARPPPDGGPARADFDRRVGLPLAQCLLCGVYGVLRQTGSPVLAKRFNDELIRVAARLQLHSRRRIVVGGSGPHPRASSPGSSSSSASGSPWGSASGSSGHSPDATTLAIRSGHSSPGPMDPIPITTAGEWLAWQTLLRLLWYQFMRDDAGFSHLVGAMPSAMGEFEPDLEFPVTAAVLASVTLPHDGPAASLPSSKLTAREVLGWMEFPDRGRRLAALTKLPEDRDMDCMQAMLLAVMCKLIRLEAWARSAGWAMVDLACAGPQSPLRLSRAARLREHLVSLIGDCILIMPPHIRKMVDADDIAGMIRYAVAQGRPMMSVVAPAGMHHLLHMMASAPQPLNPAPPAWYASPAFVSACSGAISISRFLRSGREHFADSDTSAQPYAVFYAAWIHVLAAREMLQSPELLSEAKGTVADAAICIEFLRVSGTAGWRHVAEALDAVESFLPGREAKGETVGVMAGRGDAQGAEEFMEMLEGGIRDMGIGVGS